MLDLAASASEVPEPPSTTVTLAVPTIEEIKARFAEHYPRIQRLAAFQHRGLYGDQHDDAVADTIAFAWKAYRKMALAGGQPDRLLTSIVRYSAKHVRAGKLIGGSPHVNDVMSRSARAEHGYHISHLPHSDDEEVTGEVRDALRHRVPGPAEEAITRADWQDFVKTLTPKERALAEGLEAGLNMTEIAEERGVSKAAVQDMRNTMARKWDERAAGSQDRSRR